MNSLLTYSDQRPKGIDPVHEPVDLIVDALGYVLKRVGIENTVDLLFCLLELLSC